MKKIILMLLLVMPMYMFSQTNVQNDKDSTIKSIANEISKYDITFEVVTINNIELNKSSIENMIITKVVIKNYKYGVDYGTLMFMFTENRLFGVKFIGVNNNNKYWSYINNVLNETSFDLWNEINIY